MVRTGPRMHSFISLLLLCFLYFLVFFFPTSRDGVIFKNSSYVVAYYAIISVLVMLIFLQNGKSLGGILFAFFGLAYLFFATVHTSVTIHTGFELPRFVPVLTALVVFSIRVEYVPSLSAMKGILSIVTIVLITVNIGLIFGVPEIQSIIIDTFSQFNDYTTSTQVMMRKPIFTFGVYSYGAFINMMVFYLWYIIGKHYGKVSSWQIIAQLFLIIFEIPMASSTSLVMITFMTYLLTRQVMNRGIKAMLIIIIIASVVTIYLVINASSGLDIVRLVLGTSDNGLLSRYGSELFSQNFEMMKRTFLGIGFTIPRRFNLYYSDSGYIVYFLMGNVVFLILIYADFFHFLINNAHKHATELFVVVMLFEVGLPGLIYPKIQLIMLIFVYYVNGFHQVKNDRMAV